MEYTSPCNDDFYSYYTSEPTSPRNYNHHKDGYFFLSMPTSPTKDRPGFDSRSITPVETPGKFSRYIDNFEFEGSQRFDSYENESQKSQELSMAFADELFCDGKMLPLRLPPQNRYTRPNKRRGSDSTASSPGAGSSKLKLPFMKQRSLWNDGYDPFLAALNKIKEENEGVGQHENKAQLRRSKSLSPYRRPNGPQNWNTYQHNKVGLSPERNFSGPLERNLLKPIQEPTEDTGQNKSLESRKQRIKKFLLNNASFGKEVNGQKRVHKAPLLLRKMRNSKRLGATPSNAIIRISREMKRLMKHRARIFFCLAKSFGIRGTT